jgi:hypothetical protein
VRRQLNHLTVHRQLHPRLVFQRHPYRRGLQVHQCLVHRHLHYLLLHRRLVIQRHPYRRGLQVHQCLLHRHLHLHYLLLHRHLHYLLLHRHLHYPLRRLLAAD